MGSKIEKIMMGYWDGSFDLKESIKEINAVVEQEAIGFTEWVSFSPDIYINVEKEDYFYTVDKKRYAPKELYQLYLQSKNTI